MGSNRAAQHLPGGENTAQATPWFVTQREAGAEMLCEFVSVRAEPQVPRLLPHHRNLQLQFVDVLAAAVAHRSHVSGHYSSLTLLKNSQLRSRSCCCCPTHTHTHTHTTSARPTTHVGVPRCGSTRWVLTVGQPAAFHVTGV